MRIVTTSLLLSVAIAATAYAQGAGAGFTVEQSGRSYASLSDALDAIGDGQGTVLVAPGTYRQCAVQQGGDVTIRAATPGTAILDGVTCEGKAALVLRGRASKIDGIVFQNLRVPDGNGAGIRLEKGGLDVRDTAFRNAESGILTASDAASAIKVDRSTFSGLGRCDRDLDCAHSIYVGQYGGLTVTRSRFERGTGGHYLKSRAAKIDVTDTSFDDSAGSTTNYMIDLPAGATGRITGNTFVQGKDKENHSAMITVAAEGRINPSAGLVISGNKASLAPGVSWSTMFVADWSHEPLKLGANMLGARITPFETR